ncbi:MAG: peptide chain release factor 1 [Candidatus Aminicenantes bacterium]|nr:MAG: peptide chain release factor 1 [Candidatus Aminicenantes bacterium]
MGTKSSEKLFSYLDGLHQKYIEISDELSDVEIVKNQRRFRELSRELSNLKPLHEKFLEFRALLDQKKDAQELAEFSDDEEMKELAREELSTLDQEIQELEEEIKVLMVSDHTEDSRNVFLEIRAGAGGNEASLFASDLLRMYTRIAERKVWKAEVISTTYSAIGGIKEIIVYIRGGDVNKYFKFESGVHRVQRVPVTEASGRIHTSTVTVAVMPEVEDVEIDINPKDLRIDTFCASGAGGQHVNRTESAIRITHLPTGIVVTCQDEKSQHKNKDKAMKVLKSRIYEYERDKQENDIASSRRSQVGSGERSEKIRTYNFPQNRVTDHRITGHNFSIEPILDGNVDVLIDMLTEVYTKKALEEKFKKLVA